MSVTVVSPRHLVLRHGLKAKKDLAAGDIIPKPDIGTGNQRLHSFFRPGLPAGSYTIDVKQNIAENQDGSGQTLSKSTEKVFNVIAPRYSLPAGSINAVYPPHGHSASHLTLPHVILNDPQFPWERVGSEKEESDTAETTNKNRTPWLAVLVFTPDEITLPGDIQAKLETLLHLPNAEPKKLFAPSPTLAFNINIADFVANIGESDGTLSTPLTYIRNVDGPEKDTAGDVVFVKKELLQALVRTHAVDGTPDSTQTKPDVSRYKWLSHVRKVDTTGMAEAGSTTGLLGEKDSLFSVVVSHRTGPLHTDAPTPVIAHLVSIEGLEGMQYPFQSAYVGLSSLHSWTYTSLPPDSFSVKHAFQKLGESKGLLRAPVSADELDDLRSKGKEGPGDNVANRLLDGYNLVKYRTKTGEQTSAFYRGPLTPTNVGCPLRSDWDSPSTHGTDKQIFDRQIGMMDISYTTAWQLGKTLALADRSFTIALARLRRQIQDLGLEERKKDEMKKQTLFQTKTDTIKSLTTTMKVLGGLAQSDALLSSDVTNRWQSQAPSARVDVSFQVMSDEESQKQKEKLQKQLNRAAEIVSGTLGDSSIPYDETNTPYSADWAAVLKWILDRMYLADVPPHYMMNDLSLPPETIRFFVIDRNWTDALVDGALSLANHLERSDDTVRRAIQSAIRRYLQAPPQQGQGLGRTPPVPKYGFLLRSELVTAFPDLVITTEPERGNQGQDKPVLIRHELLDTNVMLCLFDRLPDKDDFQSVTLGQPPHQPCFTIASELNSQSMQVVVKPVYTGSTKDQPGPSDRMKSLPDGRPDPWTRTDIPNANKPPIFIWGSSPGPADLRYMLTDNFAKLVHEKVRNGMGGKYNEPHPTASLTAFQLNEPTWQLKISFKEDEERTVPPPSFDSRTATSEQAVAATRMSITTAKEGETPPEGNTKRTLLSTGGFQRSKALTLDQIPPNAPLPPTADSSATIQGASSATLLAGAQLMAQSAVSPVLNVSFASIMASDGDNESTPPAGDPRYSMSVFSVDSDTNKDPLIPSKIAQDLIFSITLKDESSAAQFSLEYISILAQFDRDFETREILTSDYQGSGGFMITNLRFNVLTSLLKEDPMKGDKRCLKIDLLPRTHLKMVPVTRCLDLTFLLSGVVVERAEGDENLVLPVVVKYFERPAINREIVVKRAWV